jgi:signal peptidase I
MDDPRKLPPPPTAAAAEKPLQPTAPPADAPISTGKGVKETIESILIAFILAFVFRAFVVEAFVIPTGSMATTLLGAHMRFTCKECGYTFDTTFPSSRSGEDVDIPSRAGPVEVVEVNSRTGVKTTKMYDRSFGAYCPNCRHKVSQEEATNPAVRYGDRILVLKYLYIPWLSAPRRWDVVVFKTPTKPPAGTPWYTINYIKRLVGLPGEEVMVLDGDVYVRHGEMEPWEIQAKPKYAQDALWRVVYDHDYRPQEHDRTDGWRLPWVHNDGDGWDTGDKVKARVIRFNSLSGGARLRFDPTTVPHYNPSFAPGGYFTDWLAYDATMNQEGNSFGSTGDYTVYTVSDLKLSFFYERKAGDGPLRARMTKHDHEFVVEFEPTRVRLKHRLPNGSEVEIPALKEVNPSTMAGPMRVDFSNADYRVNVRINEELVFQTTPEQYSPNVEDLLARYGHSMRTPFATPAVSLDAARQEAAFSHVSLSRDIYYTPEIGSSEITHAGPSRPVLLKPEEYFVMGDNSSASSDARYWTEEVHLPDEKLNADSGRVPGRFMLGRAFFVYWPAGYRPLDRAPALVPNFGDMRLIH